MNDLKNIVICIINTKKNIMNSSVIENLSPQKKIELKNTTDSHFSSWLKDKSFFKKDKSSIVFVNQVRQKTPYEEAMINIKEIENDIFIKDKDLINISKEWNIDYFDILNPNKDSIKFFKLFKTMNNNNNIISSINLNLNSNSIKSKMKNIYSNYMNNSVFQNFIIRYHKIKSWFTNDRFSIRIYTN